MKTNFLYSALISWNLIGMQSQFQTDFQKQFGSGSHIYNIPLYFSRKHIYNTDKPKLHTKTYNYRDKIRKAHQKQKNEKQKRRSNLNRDL